MKSQADTRAPARNLRERICRIGLTDTEIARRIGRHQTAVSRAVSGEVDPRQSTLEAIVGAVEAEERRVLVALTALHGPPESWLSPEVAE